MTRPKLLDLFCGAGGAGVGYQRAGFDVTGVDITGHPDNPAPVLIADAIDILGNPRQLARYDAIHASPPCQNYTTMSNRWRGNGGTADSHPDLIAEVRDALDQWGGPYVIENVPGARRELHDPIILRGGMFLGVYGKLDGRRLYTRADGTNQHAPRTLEEARTAMGIDWMTWEDLTESIPPAYTEWVGFQLIDHLN